VGIVQGLMHSPRLIMLDEPTSGLDPLMQQRFFDLIEEENRKGATVFFSSHILGEVQKLCDRVAIIKDGSIIETEDIKTLRRDNYKKIYIRDEGFARSDVKLEGVSNITKKDNETRFFYKGNINDVLDILRDAEVEDILIEEPTLEEIFMHYYQ
jgi:ABC-2 type transport system ATP-binding protein